MRPRCRQNTCSFSCHVPLGRPQVSFPLASGQESRLRQETQLHHGSHSFRIACYPGARRQRWQGPPKGLQTSRVIRRRSSPNTSDNIPAPTARSSLNGDSLCVETPIWRRGSAAKEGAGSHNAPAPAFAPLTYHCFEATRSHVTAFCLMRSSLGCRFGKHCAHCVLTAAALTRQPETRASQIACQRHQSCRHAGSKT